jgi:hypothetical protein
MIGERLFDHGRKNSGIHGRIAILEPEFITNRVGCTKHKLLSIDKFPTTRSVWCALDRFFVVPNATRINDMPLSGSRPTPQHKSGRGFVAHVCFGSVSGKNPVTISYSCGGLASQDTALAPHKRLRFFDRD